MDFTTPPRPSVSRPRVPSALAVRSWLLRDLPALPVDFLRAAAGVLAVVYMLGLLAEVEDISSPNGLVPHQLLRDLVPPLRIAAFTPSWAPIYFRLAFVIGALAACGVAIGLRPRLCVLVVYGVTVSYTRWNALVTYVDDMVMQLMFFWLLLLPIGRTLTLSSWYRLREACWREWQTVRVPGMAVRAFLANVALVYLFAGVFKLESPMWRDGFALYAVLRTGISYGRDFWTSEWLSVLRPLGHAALLSELTMGFLLLLPVPWLLKRVGLLLQAALHLGIIATMSLALANLALLATLPVFLADSLLAHARRSGTVLAVDSTRRAFRSPIQWSAVVILALVTLSVAPGSPPLRERAQAILWLAGLYQNYRLFDWIDRTNYRVQLDGEQRSPDGTVSKLDPEDLFPATNRGRLLLLHLRGRAWLDVFAEHRSDIGREILHRSAARYCLRHPQAIVQVRAGVRRVTQDDPDMLQVSWSPLLAVHCDDTRAIVCAAFPDDSSISAEPAPAMDACRI